MPLRTFPTGGRNWISLPSDNADPSGMRCYGVQLPIWPVDFIPDPDPGADPESRFKPLLKIELVSPTLNSPSCHRYEFWVNNGMSRISFWFKIQQLTQVDPGTKPPTIELEFRKVVDGHPQIVATGTLKAQDFNDTGLVIQMNGLLCTGTEVWGRVPPDGQGNPQVSVQIGLSAEFDRIGSAESIILGSLFTLNGP